MFIVTQSLSLVLNFPSLFSALRLGGSLLYQMTEDQHQLLLVIPSSQFSTPSCYMTPAASKAAAYSAACLVLYCSDLEDIFWKR